MSTDRLIKPIKIVVEQIDKTTTIYNTGPAGTREPINKVARKIKVTLEAQVVFGDRDQRGLHTALGTDDQVKGYLVLKYSDLKKLNVLLQRGDRIIKLGDLDVEYYLIHNTGDSAAHFTGQSFTLVRHYFQDRKPVGESRT